MNAKKTIFAANYFCVLLLAACAGQLYKVAPLPASSPPDLSSSDGGGVNAGATALDGDRSLEQFEANLPLAGLAAIDVRLSNRSAQAIEANKLQFELSDGSGARFKQITPKKALDKVMKFYGDSFYRVDARQQTRDGYQAIALKLDGAIAPQEERRGFLFFESKSKPANLNGLNLTIKGATTPISIRLK
jgi:hypothetical protein